MERNVPRKPTAPLSSPDDLKKAWERFMEKSPQQQWREVAFPLLREALRAAAGIVAIEAEGKCSFPKRVSLLIRGWPLECMALPDIEGDVEGMSRFRAAQVVVDHLIFGNWGGPQDSGSPQYGDISAECQDEVADAIMERMGDILCLARVLFTKGELLCDEIKALLGRSADGSCEVA